MNARSKAEVASGPDWQESLNSVLAQLAGIEVGDEPELALMFASPAYASNFEDILREVKRHIRPGLLAGCSGVGIIGPGQEVEGEAALALQLLSLPGVSLKAHHLTQSDLEGDEGGWLRGTRPQEDTKAWLTFADPFTLDGEAFLRRIEESGAGLQVIGGLASGHPRGHSTHLFLDDQVLEGGAVAIEIGGAYEVKAVVSQGCAPIGESWTITGVHDNVIETIGMRPALDVPYETLGGLEPAVRERAQSNLLIGLAMNEYRDDFTRGDFLVRNLLGIDQQSGAISIGAWPREGQTLQFQMRDPEAADEDLDVLLTQARGDLAEQEPVGALLCCCTGRGIGLFGEPGHDVKKLEQIVGRLPVAGFFCNGEFGPVGGQNFLHGFTASLALILPAAS